MIEFDPAKDAKNIAVHGISLEDAGALFDGFTVEWKDERLDYGETRIIVLGEINGRVYTCVYTPRDAARRVISLRPASRGERNVYHQAKGQASGAATGSGRV